ncbi:MAG TPA: carboxypeptidase regulatory-like domain-containing protein [Candidatus Udaeobacter sp.]|nr:carboxypeptidase regulatory-like domain-containing protein [Candidatus Udaeobacter sp.]
MFPLWRWIRCGIALLAIGVAQCSAMFSAQLPSNDRNGSPDGKFTIAGTVVSSTMGAPLANARVSISDVRNPEQVQRLITTENGHFEFRGLKAAKFSLQGAKRGFLSAAYEQHEQFSTAIVTGAEYNTENLVLRLTPLAFLSGKIIDEFGDPVRTAQVSVYLKSTRAGISRVTLVGNDSTDDQGYYEFSALAPGDYFLSAAGKPWYAVHPALLSAPGGTNSPPNVPRSLDVVYPTTFYNGATEADGAAPIAVKAGDRVQIDVHLSPFPSLHLLFRVPEQQQDLAMPTLQKRVFDSMETMTDNAQMISPGVWELTGVPPGRYTLTRQQEGGQPSSEIALREDGQELGLSHGEPAARVKFKVTLPPGEPPPKQLFLALRNSRQQVVANRALDAAGEITFENISPGKYAVLAGSSAKPYSVARVSSQGIDITGHDVNIPPGASLDLTVFLAGGVVTIEGVVTRGDRPAAGIMVALVPKDPQSHQEMFRRDQSDFDGTFLLRGVLPGSYTIVAVEDAWGFEWQEPGVLARYVQRGQNLTIGELMRGSVHLPEPVEVQPH